MDLYKELLVNTLAKEEIIVEFPNLKINVQEIVELQSYKVLLKIKALVENNSLSDFECIEAIVCALEDVGSSGGSRHDF